MSLMDEVRKTVADRGENYGDPKACWDNVGKAWSAFLRNRRDDHDITGREAAMMMVILKAVRDAHTPIDDNVIDVHGYAWVAEQCESGG